MKNIIPPEFIYLGKSQNTTEEIGKITKWAPYNIGWQYSVVGLRICLN